MNTPLRSIQPVTKLDVSERARQWLENEVTVKHYDRIATGHVRNLLALLDAAAIKPDPDSTLAMHLSNNLKPDCCCAVCDVFREYLDELLMGEANDEQG